MDYLLAVEKALMDYADWVSGKRDFAKFYKEGELRGIFYNKLVTRLREAGVNIGRFRKILYPADLICQFSTPGSLEGVTLDFNKIYSYAYHFPERKTILLDLGEAMKQIDMTKLSNRFNWELTKIVNSLKNL